MSITVHSNTAQGLRQGIYGKSSRPDFAAARQNRAGERREKNATNEKAKRMLGWAPRSNEEAIVATAESLVRFGLLKDSPKKAAQIG
jgi:nucleoside-diphosphate-sugar epimerase